MAHLLHIIAAGPGCGVIFTLNFWHFLCSGGSMEHSHGLWIFVPSDGSGRTGKRVLEAALLQFDRIAMVVRIPPIATTAEVKELLAEAAGRKDAISYERYAVQTTVN
jgi:hypothetical protein